MNGDCGQTAALYGAAVADIGKPHFSDSLMRAIALSVASIDHCSIFQFRPRERVRHIGTASFISLDKGMQSAERYADGLHAYDPMRAFMARIASRNGIHLYKLTPDRIREQQYRDSFAQLQTIERVSVLIRNRGVWSSLNLYRSRALGCFSGSELQRLADSAPLLASLADKHSEFVAAQTAETTARQIEEWLRGNPAGLSEREVEVCKLALLGYRSEAIADLLALRTGTVLTYRKRAYAKLGISSQNELFRLCLSTRHS